MSCSPKGRDNIQQNHDWSIPRRTGWWERITSIIIMALLTSLAAFRISSLWMGDWRLDDWRKTSKSNWTQMSGNDGKFWKGTPDNSAYAHMEGAELRVYYQYFYDEEGRLSKVNTFRHHENYGDVWVLSNEETYEYDSEGRVSRRQEVQGDTRKVYEYTSEGYTETGSSSYRSNGKIAKYDLAGNMIYFRNADNYRYPHVTTYEYDGKNRLIKKISEVEGKEPYGVPPYVSYTAEYDEENYTSVETEYDSHGEATYIWYNTYDENWNKTGSVWYDPKKVPEGYSPEECAEYYTRGYWSSASDGKLLEEMENKPWKDTKNNSTYTAYDYDGRGNCILELKIYFADSAYLYRYVYDDRNRLTEQYNYNIDDVKFWEQMQWDGSRLTLQASDDKVLSITRTAPDGSLLNRFDYGKWDVDTQQTPEGTVSWQLNPSLILADKGPKPGKTEPAGPGETKPGQSDTDVPSRPKKFLYTVEKGDCLWKLAEKFLGDGRKYRDIYKWNSDVIGDDPRLILPGVRLYIETE